jgi:hypothetical protein
MGLNPNISRKPGPNGKHAFYGTMAKETKKKVLIKRIRSDNGGEFISSEMQDQWRSEGIERQLTVAHAHNQVGVAEKAFGDIVSHAVSVLEDAKLPLNLWYEITRTL